MIFLIRLLLQRKIRKCHHRQWMTLMHAERLWWREGMGIEVYEGCDPPSTTYWLDSWHKARVLVCKHCGGTLDEITFCYNILESGDTKFYRSSTNKKLFNGCGNIEDWHWATLYL